MGRARQHAMDDSGVDSHLSRPPGALFVPWRCRRHFNFAVSGYAAFVLMPALLQRLAIEAPQLGCHLEPVSAAACERMQTGTLDLLVTAETRRVVPSHPESALASYAMAPLACSQVLMWHPRNNPDPEHWYVRALFIDVAQNTQPKTELSRRLSTTSLDS